MQSVNHLAAPSRSLMVPASSREPLSIRADIVLDPRYGTDRLAICDLEFPGFRLHFYCGTQLARRQHTLFHGSRDWLSVDAPFSPGVYAIARITHRSDAGGNVESFEFAEIDQYQLPTRFAGAGRIKNGVHSQSSPYGNRNVL